VFVWTAKDVRFNKQRYQNLHSYLNQIGQACNKYKYFFFQKVYGWEKNVGKGPVQHAANNDADEDEEDWDNDAPVPGKG
jgi:restriction endonuclease S subunit